MPAGPRIAGSGRRRGYPLGQAKCRSTGDSVIYGLGHQMSDANALGNSMGREKVGLVPLPTSHQRRNRTRGHRHNLIQADEEMVINDHKLHQRGAPGAHQSSRSQFESAGQSTDLKGASTPPKKLAARPEHGWIVIEVCDHWVRSGVEPLVQILAGIDARNCLPSCGTLTVPGSVAAASTTTDLRNSQSRSLGTVSPTSRASGTVDPGSQARRSNWT